MELSESIDRFLDEGDSMVERFYKLLLERVPEARPYFEDVNMKTQFVMLAMALNAVKQHPHLRKGAEAYLQVLGTKHKNRGIPKELYGGFIEVLLEAAAEFHGNEWDQDLARQWSDALGRAKDLMFEGYEQHFHV